MKITIIIPALNEETGMVRLLTALSGLREKGHEVIVVDGGSSDRTMELAAPLCDQVIASSRGRAVQMNLGARHASGDYLWFLHADSQLLQENLDVLPGLLADRQWGWLTVRLSGNSWLYRIIERMMNLRSRLTGIATGDQGIWVASELFRHVGGYAEIPLMEDIDLCKKLRAREQPSALQCRVVTSSRRWEENGPLSTILLMWWLRLRYFMGENPGTLAEKYYG